jgi:adenosylcobinamide-GDP ribazoletransferase
MVLVDGWRLATGTLTAIPVPGPTVVDQRTAGTAILLAPIAVLPLGTAVTGLGLVGARLDVPVLVLGMLGVGLLAWATRALHWDGLSDVADGLTSGFDAARSLAVMKTGTSGPAGTLAVVVVAGLQAAGLAALFTTDRGAVLAGLVVLASRCALVLTCAAPVRPAREDGLGLAFAGSVPVLGAVTSWLLACAVVAATCAATGTGVVRPLVGLALSAFGVLVLVRHTSRRLGGVTGDVYGAAVEVALATMLVAAA